MIFKAFALTGRKADCWFTQGECPGLGASAPSGRVGANLRQFRSSPFTLLIAFFSYFS
jgi:hypothetical protein